MRGPKTSWPDASLALKDDSASSHCREGTGKGKGRNKLADRLVALFCWVPDASEGEKMHYFLRGFKGP